MADDAPRTWQTVQRLAGLGCDSHNIAHMIAGLVAEDPHAAMAERRATIAPTREEAGPAARRLAAAGFAALIGRRAAA